MTTLLIGGAALLCALLLVVWISLPFAILGLLVVIAIAFSMGHHSGPTATIESASDLQGTSERTDEATLSARQNDTASTSHAGQTPSDNSGYRAGPPGVRRAAMPASPEHIDLPPITIPVARAGSTLAPQ